MVDAQAPPSEAEVTSASRRMPAPPGGDARFGTAVVVAAAVCCGLVAVSMLVGSGGTPPARALDFLLGRGDARADGQLRVILVSLRLPRTVAALLVGVALGAGGVLLQSATRNVLAETGLLGVNGGAALGVVVGITVAGAETGQAYLIWALCGALLASAAVLAVAAAGPAGGSPLRLLLAGLALGMTFKGLTGALLLSSATAYDQYRFWVLGSLSGVEPETVLVAVPVVGVGLLLAGVLVRPLSALALGDDVARALGHRPAAVRSVVAAAVTLLAASAVAVAGPIAFLGLLAPFIARAVAGPRTGAQLGLAALAGPAVLLTADIAARLVVRPYEAPASVLIALIGAPVLIAVARSPRLLTLGGTR
nr:ABC transporter permease [uncultured bacterium]